MFENRNQRHDDMPNDGDMELPGPGPAPQAPNIALAIPPVQYINIIHRPAVTINEKLIIPSTIPTFL